MLNHITLMGRLTRDPELRYTNDKKPVTSFTLAVDRDGKAGGVDFIDCVAWENTATFAANYFKKGSVAIVTGRLQMRNWQDRDGNKRINAEVKLHAMYFGDSKKKDADDTPKITGAAFSDLRDADGELPF